MNIGKIGALAGLLGLACAGRAAAYTIDLYVDGKLAGTTTTDSFVWDTTKLPDGPHALHSVYRDDSGRTVVSETIRVTVANRKSDEYGQPRLRPPLLTLTVSGVPQVALGDEPHALMIKLSRGARQSLVFSEDVLEASVVDLKGRLLLQSGPGAAPVSPDLPAGLYMLSIRTASGRRWVPVVAVR